MKKALSKTKKSNVPVPARRKPIPIAGRISNSELQAELDATLDIRILGDTKLRNATRADLLRSAEEDERAAKALLAGALSKREFGRRVAKLRQKK